MWTYTTKYKQSSEHESLWWSILSLHNTITLLSSLFLSIPLAAFDKGGKEANCGAGRNLCLADAISIDKIWAIYLRQWSCHYTRCSVSVFGLTQINSREWDGVIWWITDKSLGNHGRPPNIKPFYKCAACSQTRGTFSMGCDCPCQRFPISSGWCVEETQQMEGGGNRGVHLCWSLRMYSSTFQSSQFHNSLLLDPWSLILDRVRRLSEHSNVSISALKIEERAEEDTQLHGNMWLDKSTTADQSKNEGTALFRLSTFISYEIHHLVSHCMCLQWRV